MSDPVVVKMLENQSIVFLKELLIIKHSLKKIVEAKGESHWQEVLEDANAEFDDFMVMGEE